MALVLRLRSLVEEGACNIARAVAEEEDSISDDFLGVTYEPRNH